MKGSLGSKDERVRIATQSNSDILYQGIVIRVDAMNNVMDVNVSASVGSVSNPVKNIPINNLVTNFGMGIRMMPIAGVTFVILERINAEEWIHIGYYNDDISRYISDQRCDKEDNNVSGKLLQRHVGEGEVIVSNFSDSEVFLSRDGSIMLSSKYNAFLKLDNDMSRLDGLFANTQLEMDGVRLRAGNTIRPIDQDTQDDIYILDVEDSVTKEYDLPEGEDGDLIKEFTVSVGTLQDEDTGIDAESSPTVGLMSLATKVVSELGIEEKVLDKSLNYLLKFPIVIGEESKTGFSMSVSNEGEVVFLDQTNGNYIKFKTSNNKDDESLHETDLEIKINKCTFNINKDGEFTYSNEKPDDATIKTTITADNTGTVSISSSDAVSLNIGDGASKIDADKDGNVSIESSTSITIKSGDVGVEAGTLGDTLRDVLKDLVTKISTHTHGWGKS